MKNKTLHIQFSSIDDLAREAKEILKTKKADEFAGRDIRFENYDQFMGFLFPNKFSLLVAIKIEQPQSLYQLAQIIGRQQSAVLRDCDELEMLGFIKYETGPRNSKIPRLPFEYDTIIVHDNRGIQSHQLPKKAA